MAFISSRNNNFIKFFQLAINPEVNAETRLYSILIMDRTPLLNKDDKLKLCISTLDNIPEIDRYFFSDLLTTELKIFIRFIIFSKTKNLFLKLKCAVYIYSVDNYQSVEWVACREFILLLCKSKTEKVLNKLAADMILKTDIMITDCVIASEVPGENPDPDVYLVLPTLELEIPATPFLLSNFTFYGYNFTELLKYIPERNFNLLESEEENAKCLFSKYLIPFKIPKNIQFILDLIEKLKDNIGIFGMDSLHSIKNDPTEFIEYCDFETEFKNELIQNKSTIIKNITDLFISQIC